MSHQLKRFIIPCWLLTLASFVPLALCQAPVQQSTPDEETFDFKLHDLLVKVWKSHFDPFLGESAVPALKEAFTKTSVSIT